MIPFYTSTSLQRTNKHNVSSQINDSNNTLSAPESGTESGQVITAFRHSGILPTSCHIDVCPFGHAEEHPLSTKASPGYWTFALPTEKGLSLASQDRSFSDSCCFFSVRIHRFPIWESMLLFK